MKKTIMGVLTLLWVSMIVLEGCSSSPKAKIFSIESPQKIIVTSISGEKIEVSDEDKRQQITDNITSIQFERGESSIDTNGFGPMISWYNSNGDVIESISVMSNDTIIYNNYFWTAINGSVDMEVINAVLSTDTSLLDELTMEVLLELYENDGLTIKVEEEGLEGFLAYGNMKPVSGMEDSLTGLYICDLVYPYTFDNGITSDRNYELQLSYWRPETAEEYGHTENEIDNIRLMEKEFQDAVLLYEVDERFTPTKDLQGFLQRDYGMEQYLICDLPGDFTLGKYREDIGFCSGWLLEGETEEPPHDEGISEAWYCPGGIGRGETASQILQFDSGILTDAALMMNHTEQLGETEILEGCEVQAVLVEYAFDLFTAAGWEDYLSQHPGVEEVLKSQYWYVFLGKEDSEIFYALFLNQEHFTKDDVIRMAQSVQFTERAF